MANMSYCRFENTFRDLQDCVDNIHNVSSEREKRYRSRMFDLCQQFMEEYDDVKHDDEDEDEDEDSQD